ncbi:MAG: hypothetical protein MRY32_09155 [Rickettsiales bacterium]|nr:hypothetical protein [Rickettsiales bacterium]
MKHVIYSLVVLSVLAAPIAQAREFRVINAIPAPAVLPDGASAVKEIKQVDRRIIEKIVGKLAASWNTQDLKKYLGEDFYDKQRLSDNISTYIQRDGKLNVLGIQGQQTLQQYEENGKLVSRVSVIVNTQIEFNHPTAGFQRFPGRTELVFKVKQRL